MHTQHNKCPVKAILETLDYSLSNFIHFFIKPCGYSLELPRGYSLELPQKVEAMQMSTHNI